MAGRYAGGQRASARAQQQRIAQRLGWFSVGLGLAQVIAPRAICRLVGMPVVPTFMRICGLREIACGIGILTQADRTP
ncbi:MAG: SRPBCC family protein, partial [Burkholderiales bacterium]